MSEQQTQSYQNGLARLKRSIDPRTEEEKQAAFLGALMDVYNMKAAVAKAGITYSQVLGWRKFDQNFADAYNDTIFDMCAEMEAEAYRRAMKGVEKPIYQNGEYVGSQIVYSDDLLKLLLKAYMPEKYREKLTVEKNTNTQNTVLVMPSNGREMQIPEGVEIGQFSLPPRHAKPDVSKYIPRESSDDLESEDITD